MTERSFFRKLSRNYLLFAAGFGGFLLALTLLEQEGMPRIWIGYLFMFATIVLYATLGVLSRTSNVLEYYVAGRRVPAMFNGMATAADWISAASFNSLAAACICRVSTAWPSSWAGPAASCWSRC